MKQFVGIYAVGDDGSSALSMVGATNHTPVFISELAVSGDLPTDPRFLPLGMMERMKSGLYLGVVTVGNIVEVKVIPMKLANQQLLAEVIDPALYAKCLHKIDILFGAVPEEGDGEPTPGYVNQDQS